MVRWILTTLYAIQIENSLCDHHVPYCLNQILTRPRNCPNTGFQPGIAAVRRSVVSDFLRPHGLQPTRLPGPWDFPGMNTGVGCHLLLQGILLTQGSSPGLPHCRQKPYHPSHHQPWIGPIYFPLIPLSTMYCIKQILKYFSYMVYL